MYEEKVLVGSPVYQGTKYCIREFLDCIKNLEYNNYDILLVDNSKNNEFFLELEKEKGIKVIKDDCQDTLGIKKVISSRNKIFEYAVENSYNYVLMMDSDVIPPANIISELMKWKKDIVSGVYYNYFRVSGELKFLPVVWKSITEKEFYEIKKQGILSEQFTSPSHIRRHLTEEEVQSGQLLEVFIPSAGCMLLNRKVFEKVSYGLLSSEEIIGTSTSDDIYFIKKAREKNFQAYCYTKMKCEHRIAGKFEIDAHGNLLHPLYR